MNFLSNKNAYAQKLTDMGRELGLLPEGVVIGTSGKMPRSKVLQTILYFATQEKLETEDQQKARYDNYKTFVAEVMKPEYDILFAPEPVKGGINRG